MDTILKSSKINNAGAVQFFVGKPFDASQKDFSKFELEYDLRKIVAPVQKHTANVAVVTDENIDAKFENTDGLITNLTRVGLGVVTADCQSVVIVDPVKKVVANLHSGWRGTMQGIVEVGVKKMIEEFGSRPQDFVVYFAPCIHTECFEVDEDLANEFGEKFGNKYVEKSMKLGKYLVDTVQINVDVLTGFGVLRDNIEIDSNCTKCEADKFHSYRANGTAARNLSVVALAE